MVWTQISEAGLDLLRAMDPVIQRIPVELLGHIGSAELAEMIRLLELRAPIVRATRAVLE